MTIIPDFWLHLVFLVFHPLSLLYYATFKDKRLRKQIKARFECFLSHWCGRKFISKLFRSVQQILWTQGLQISLNTLCRDATEVGKSDKQQYWMQQQYKKKLYTTVAFQEPCIWLDKIYVYFVWYSVGTFQCYVALVYTCVQTSKHIEHLSLGFFRA